MIKYLNENAGAIQTIGTLVLVAVTGWYAWLTRRMVAAAERSQRPYVYVDVRSGSGLDLDLGISNLGDRAAESLKFDIVRNVSDAHGQPITAKGAWANGITYLPPGRGYRYFVPVSDALFTGAPGVNVFDVLISYKHGDATYDDRVTIDFADFRGAMLKSFRDSGEEVARAIGDVGRQIRETGRPDTMGRLTTQPCPICAERIPIGARKCPRCHEWLTPSTEDSAVPDGAHVDRRKSIDVPERTSTRSRGRRGSRRGETAQ